MDTRTRKIRGYLRVTSTTGKLIAAGFVSLGSILPLVGLQMSTNDPLPMSELLVILLPILLFSNLVVFFFLHLLRRGVTRGLSPEDIEEILNTK